MDILKKEWLKLLNIDKYGRFFPNFILRKGDDILIIHYAAFRNRCKHCRRICDLRFSTFWSGGYKEMSSIFAEPIAPS
jgi:hypothetical protein